MSKERPLLLRCTGRALCPGHLLAPWGTLRSPRAFRALLTEKHWSVGEMQIAPGVPTVSGPMCVECTKALIADSTALVVPSTGNA